MTKDEFNKKWPMSGIPDSIRAVAVAWGDAHNWFIEDKVKLAQDILEATDTRIQNVAELQSIAFTSWIASQEGENKIVLVDGQWYWESDVDGDQPLSEDALYSLFLTHQSPQP